MRTMILTWIQAFKVYYADVFIEDFAKDFKKIKKLIRKYLILFGYFRKMLYLCTQKSKHGD